MVEGILILSCLIPALHFQDSTWPQILVSGLFPFNLGLLMLVRYHKYRTLAKVHRALRRQRLNADPVPFQCYPDVLICLAVSVLAGAFQGFSVPDRRISHPGDVFTDGKR